MISEIDFPTGTSVNGKESEHFFRDSFLVRVSREGLQAKQVYHGIFGYLPKSVRLALKLRNSVMKWSGFSASNTEMSLPLDDIKAGNKAGFLTIEQVSDKEVVCGAYEKNMDMWLSVMRLSDTEFAVSTLVNLKTRSGKLYMAAIKPFHKFVATYSIKQALKAGRI